MDFLMRLDRRWLYLIVFAVVLWPLVLPLGIPFRVSPGTMEAYKVLDALKPGDTVLMSIDYSVGGSPDIDPQAQAVFRYLMKKNVKVVMVAFVDQGVQFAEKMIREQEKLGKKYGEDFVNLGFVAGVEVAISAFAENVPKVFPKDNRGNSIDSLPIMKGITSVKDFKLVTEFATGIPGPAEWIRQVGTKYKVPIVSGVVTVMYPQSLPYVQSKQLAGLMGGLRGAAEFEKVSNTRGMATAAMDAQSMGHLAIILFIILGNIAYQMEKRRQVKK